MEKTKQKVYELCELKEKLMCCVRDELSKGIQHVNTHELGDAIDMIKDLAEAEEKCWKARYYESIVEAMHEEKEMDEMMAKMGRDGEGRMGYDSYRYSSGRFAPKGHGHYSGYTPTHTEDPWMSSYGIDGMNKGPESSGPYDGRMGYTGSDRGHRFDKYTKARMGYHQSKDASSKEQMDMSAREYVMDIADSVEEIWRDADPAMRKEIKNKFVALTGKMN